MCLEICDSPEEIQEQLETIHEKSHILSGVSFEKYTLGSHCELVTNHTLTPITKSDLGHLDSWPLISSYPHYPEFITWFRSVIFSEECATAFIDQAVSEARSNGYTGYNLDWEPVWSEGGGHELPLTERDAKQYARFIDKFAKRLHDEGFKLGVDVASWSSGNGAPPVWDYNAISSTAVDKVISMSTYTSNDDSFSTELTKLMDAFGTDRAGVGLMTVNASDNQPLSMQEIEYRFNLIKESGAQEVDVWAMPIPDTLWMFLERFVAGE
jgi:hypothetical protein